MNVNVKVFLQGPYNGAGGMTTALNTNSFIPLTSETAYPSATYGYTASTVTSIPTVNIVDWVLVELRNNTTTAASTVISKRAGFLRNDGAVVDIDGASPLFFLTTAPGNYYIIIRHRNHLAIMSAAPVALNSSSALYDFTTAQTQAYGTNPMKLLSTGIIWNDWW